MPWTLPWNIDHDTQTLYLDVYGATDTPTFSSLANNAFSNLVTECINQRSFPRLDRHSEPFAIPGTPYPVQIERFATSLFGTTTQGAHMTAYTHTTSGLKIWVPRRSAHLHTYPGRLDTTVAGGVSAHETPFENIVREAEEEASLPSDLVREHARSVGCLTYMGMADDGRVLPDIIYCYDLELAPEIVPKPDDDEVEAFYLMGVEEVKASMLRQEFKTNCAVVMIDFFIRHGIVTASNEPDYVEIVMRMHRRLPFRTTPPRS